MSLTHYSYFFASFKHILSIKGDTKIIRNVEGEEFTLKRSKHRVTKK